MPKIGNYAKAKPLQNGQFGSKIKIPKNVRKTTVHAITLELICGKNGSKKGLIFEE